MRTPISDFVESYAASGITRLHMPGHKGVGELERQDITEVNGADSLYEADGIIAESEAYASEIFGSDTFYSAEGSSLAIRAMLYLALTEAKERGRAPLILAGRNAHRSFISAVALLGLDVEWLGGESSYMSASIGAEALSERLDSMNAMPAAVYITSPDYLGFTSDIPSLAEVCHKRGVMLLVDNAHGAYLKFLTPSRHPIDLGADMCADSAHKTLPVLTGGAYLHISHSCTPALAKRAKSALALFGSSSPSYIILASLDRINPYLSERFSQDLTTFVSKIAELKREITKLGYTTVGDEDMKITICAKPYGYLGTELADRLRSLGIEPELADPDYVVLMPSPKDAEALAHLHEALMKIEKRDEITAPAPAVRGAERVYSIREATLSPSHILPLSECVGKVLAIADVACPPAVPILMPGERITEEHIEVLKYYGKSDLSVIEV